MSQKHKDMHQTVGDKSSLYNFKPLLGNDNHVYEILDPYDTEWPWGSCHTWSDPEVHATPEAHQEVDQGTYVMASGYKI